MPARSEEERKKRRGDKKKPGTKRRDCSVVAADDTNTGVRESKKGQIQTKSFYVRINKSAQC